MTYPLSRWIGFTHQVQLANMAAYAERHRWEMMFDHGVPQKLVMQEQEKRTKTTNSEPTLSDCWGFNTLAHCLVLHVLGLHHLWNFCSAANHCKSIQFSGCLVQSPAPSCKACAIEYILWQSMWCCAPKCPKYPRKVPNQQLCIPIFTGGHGPCVWSIFA